MNRIWVIALTLLVVSSGWAAQIPKKMRIVCIGDSITQGRKGIANDPKTVPTYSWRYPLWRKLIDAGVEAEFVGDHEGGFEGSPEYAPYKGRDFVNRHEAWWGWTTVAVAEKVEAHAFADRADLALVLLGGNDDAKKNGLDPTMAAMRRIVEALRKANGKVRVIIARPYMEWEPFPAMGEAYTKLAAELSTAKSPVSTVMPPDGWVSKPDEPNPATVDWVHPNPRGDELLAERFFQAIKTKQK